MAFVASYSANG